MSTRKAHQKIAANTLGRVESIVACTLGASLNSTFIASQLPVLDSNANPAHEGTPIRIVNADSFTAARAIARSIKEDCKGKIAVLNLASDELPGGGWKYSLSRTQEEALCYSSTLFPTLQESYYPWPNVGPGSVAGIYSPRVVIFKDDLDHKCADLPQTEWLTVGVLTVAAPRNPPLPPNKQRIIDNSVLKDFQEKIRLVYRMAASNGHLYLVLGAMGCGAYLWPPRLVADMMKRTLLEPEFHGWFKEVVFAIYSTPSNGGPNYAVFEEAFQGVQLNTTLDDKVEGTKDSACTIV